MPVTIYRQETREEGIYFHRPKIAENNTSKTAAKRQLYKKNKGLVYIKVKASPKPPRVNNWTEKLNQMIRQIKIIKLSRLTLFILGALFGSSKIR